MTTSEIRETGRSAETVAPPEVAGPGDRPAAYATTPAEDLATVVLGALMVGGVLTDAWAHTNIIDTIESFFTPWHAMLYSGFTALALWTFWLAFRNRHQTSRWWRDGWPAGYRVGAIGAVGFAVAGLGDMVWHSVLGVEIALEVSFSPSHILLSFSSVLLLSSPLRSWWASGESGLRSLAGALSLALAATMANVLLLGFTAFATVAPTLTYDAVYKSPNEDVAAVGVAAYLVTTIIIVTSLLWVHRRQPFAGMVTALVALVGFFAVMTYDLAGTLVTAWIGALGGALLADVALHRLDRVRGTDAALRLPVAGALAATLVWSGHLAGLALAEGIRWPTEMWVGVPVFTALLAAVLGGLAAPPRLDSSAAPPRLDGSAAPPRLDGSAAPPRSGSAAAPPRPG